MSAGQVGNGYQIQAAEVDSEADKLDAAGDDTAEIRTAVTATQCYPAQTLGGSDMGPAFSDYAGAWEAEAKTLSEALHELADRVRVSTRAYGGAERDAITGLSAAKSGGDIVAPIGYGDRPFPGGISTQPAQADPRTTPSVFG